MLGFLSVSQDVESLMDIAEHLSIMHSSGNLLSSLIFGAKWLKNVSEVISAPRKFKACNLTDAEEMLAEYQVFFIIALPLVLENFHVHTWELG